MEELLKSALLYDFYGELLTQHQRDIYEDFVLNDLSLGEIAQNRGISRQAVYDIVKRCRKQLLSYEEKLHLVKRFMDARKEIGLIAECAQAILSDTAPGSRSAECAEKIKQLAGRLSKEL